MVMPLIVLLGAGASAALGIPGTNALTTQAVDRLRYAEKSSNLMVHPGLVEGLRSDRLLKQLQHGYGASFNFEHLLHALEAISALNRSWRTSTKAPYRVVEGILCGGPAGSIADCFSDLYPIVGSRALFEALFDGITSASAQMTAGEEWPAWLRLVGDLRANFDVRFATTNYDHAIELTGGFTPEDEGFCAAEDGDIFRFDARLRSQIRLMHLHGNLRFGYRPMMPGAPAYLDDHEELYWFMDPAVAHKTWFGRSNATGGAGQNLHRGPLITGLYKPDKLLIDPYRTYSEVFGTWIMNCPRLLVVGYGFGDPHLNYVLRRLNRWHGIGRRVAYLGYQSSWPPDPRSFPDTLKTIASWAGESGPMSACLELPAPYTPEGSGRACFQAWFGGLGDVLSHHVQALVSFLAS